MSEEDQSRKITEVLKNNGELFTKQVAKKAKLSVNTASKYLSILEGEGKVIKRTQKPFKFWSLKEKAKSVEIS